MKRSVRYRKSQQRAFKLLPVLCRFQGWGGVWNGGSANWSAWRFPKPVELAQIEWCRQTTASTSDRRNCKKLKGFNEMEFVKTRVEAHIGFITLDRPEKLNAMTRAMYQEISRALVDMDCDNDVWVIVVNSSAPKAFSAGADLSVLHTVLTQGDFEWNAFRPDRFDMGLRVSKPVIASIAGHCLAGGLELALSCDLRIAARDAKLGTPEVKWSVLHGYGALVMPHLTSLGKAMELMFTGESISGEEAERIGLVNQAVDAADLTDATLDMAQKICRNGPIAVRMTKEIILRGLSLDLHDGLRLYRELNRAVHTSADSVEGMRAWRDRRPANYQNR